MAKRKKPATATRQSKDTGTGSDRSRLIIQSFALLLVIGLVVYLLVTGFMNGQDGAANVNTGARAGSTSNPGNPGNPANPGTSETDIEAPPAAPVTIEPALVQFGEVPQNTMQRQQVTLTNTGSSPLRIVDARPSCPCTTVNRQASTIAPGRSITLDIEMDSESRLGPKGVNVNVTFAGYQPKRIPISATVVQDPT